MTPYAAPAGADMRPDRNIAALALLAAVALAPWFAGQFALHLAVLTALNVLVVNGLALVSRSGQLSLGHAAFMAVGAYTAVLAGNYFGLSFIVSALAGAAATALAAFALGWVILRLRGVYFVLVTFAFGELVRLVLLDLSDITGGANGIAGIAAAEILGFAFDTRARFYGLALFAALASSLFMRALFRRPIGHAIDSIADNAALAESTGLSVHRLQLFAFVAGCALAAIGGALQARYIGYISPESFNTSVSIGFIIMLVIGGRQSSWGPLVGAVVLTPLPELFRGAVQTQHMFYGAALILILRFLPGGLARLPGLLRKLAGRERP
ncbi:branched-chain amino acid ABC transporter permease [Pollutimonas bauzanensis]|uniref:Branched-chain amino acid transport system permease protein n=1 Tax=Pollutimonas bauzanensis TaxID=658167 RepID=A0A1M5PW51_9BURK|nr:branched-chain amino acid ABC transporter permease [Pollutimonas bauzanensis]SHH06105.1 branched-chain amino acid transport system permease protein [Pollutimonas bauzanensis]